VQTQLVWFVVGGKMRIPYVLVIGGGSVLMPAIMDGTTRSIRSAKVY
jgi:hypothetical protein